MGPAAKIVAPTFNAAQSGIQAQIPALQNLYTSLMQGLQAQAGQQVQNVNQSAMQRGVYQQTTPMSTQDMLNQALMQSGAQMNVQRAQDVAGLQGQVGVSNMNRAQATVDQKGATEQVGLAKQQNQLALQQLQQDYNVKQAQYQKAQAEAAARKASSEAEFDITNVSKEQLERQLRLGLSKVQGKDKYVSPENLARAYNTWQSAGLDTESFWRAFQGKWNPKQTTYNDEFQYFVRKGV